MRRLIGDRKDFSRVDFIFLFLLSLLLQGADIYCQLPLNGFSSYRKIQVNPAFGKIFTLDYDNNNQTDFFLFNPLGNKTALQKNIASENKITSQARFAPLAITDMKPVIQIKRKELLYFAISQKDRKAALLSISSGGGISARMIYKFDSYPTATAVADINGDGNSEAVVCGNNFKGISLFFLKNRMEEVKAVSEGVYSSVAFIDLNYDGYPDLAAYESRKNTIEFFINDQNGNFRKARNLKFDPSVKAFKTADVNSDGYMDIILLKHDGINVLAGDSVSSFKKSYFVRTPVQPDEVTVDDYNGDGINDLAYINKSSGEFFLQMNKGNGNYYYPVLMLKRKSLADMKSFRDSFLKKIVLLNSDGELYVFSKFDSRKEMEKISVFGNVSALNSFEDRNTGMRGLAIADSYQKALIILQNEPGNPISKYYSVRTSSVFENITIYDSGKNERIFFLYSTGNNLVEIIKYNFDNLKIEKNTLYVRGNILDLKLKSSPESSNPDIYILSGKMDPGFAIYRFKGYHYSEVRSGKTSGGFLDGAVSISDSISILSWKRSLYGMEYNGYSFSHPLTPFMLYKYDKKLQDDMSLNTMVIPAGGNEFINLSLVVNGKEVDGVIYDPKVIRTLDFEVKSSRRTELSKESVYLYNNSGDKRKILFIYDFANSIFYKADLNSKSRIITVRGSDKTEGIVKYIADKTAGRKMKLIYTANNDNCLNFKEIE